MLYSRGVSQLTRRAASVRIEPGSGGVAMPAPRTPRRSAAHPGPWARVVAVNLPAVAVTAAIFGWMLARSADGTNVAGLQMPAMDLSHRVGYWWPFLMGETLGIAALIWAYLSVFLGLVFSTRRPTWLGLTRSQINDWHRQVSLTTIALIVGHALFVAVGSMNGAMTERTVDFTTAFLPFTTDWQQWPYAFGIFAMYLAILIGPTYYLRRRLGDRAWRITHRLSLAVYVLCVVHTFYFDDFDFHGAYRMALWVAQIPLAGMLLWRLVSPAARRRRMRSATTGPAPWSVQRLLGGMLVTIGLSALCAVVVTGHIGGEPSPFPGSPSHHTSPTSHGMSGMSGM